MKTSEARAAADREFTEMQQGIRAEVAVRSRSLQDLWATPAMLKRTLVAVGVQVFGQFSGINGMARSCRRSHRVALSSSLVQSSIISGPLCMSPLGLRTGSLC